MNGTRVAQLLSELARLKAEESRLMAELAAEHAEPNHAKITKLDRAALRELAARKGVRLPG